MDKRISLIGIFIHKKEVFYKTGKKISGEDVAYTYSSKIGITQKMDGIQVVAFINLTNPENTKEVYVHFEIACNYQCKIFKTEKEKEMVSICACDAYAVMRGVIFMELKSTKLDGTIIPTISLDEIKSELVKDVPTKKKKLIKKPKK